MSTEESTVRSKELDKQMRRDFRRNKQIIKLLLLGTGESGKSTIVKQMKILHGSEQQGNGLTEEVRMKQKKIVLSNVLDSIKAILQATVRFGFEVSATESKEAVEKFLELRTEEHLEIDEEIVRHMKTLWTDPALQKTFNRRSEFQLLDSAAYFLNAFDRISRPDYIPTQDDVLRARSITTGVVVVPFEVQNLKFELVDVGGQRSERKKWIHVFDDVTAVMFIIALSEYDQVLYEDGSTNRMKESLKLFNQMLTTIYFIETPFILFLNKEDIFDEKIEKHNITSAFPEYTGRQIAQEAKAYIKAKFLSGDDSTNDSDIDKQKNRKKRERKQEIYSFFTTATDTRLVNNVFNSVKEIIINDVLKNMGMH